MFCAYTRPRYQVSVYRTNGPLVISNIINIAALNHVMSLCDLQNIMRSVDFNNL